MADHDLVARVLRVHQGVAMAMAASLVVYAVIVEVLQRQGVVLIVLPERFLDTLRYVAVFSAFAVYFGIRWLQQKILSKKPADTREILLGKLSRASLLSLLLAELPALMGFGLFLASGNSRDFYLLMVISLILLYITFPRQAIWEVWSTPRDMAGQRGG